MLRLDNHNIGFTKQFHLKVFCIDLNCKTLTLIIMYNQKPSTLAGAHYFKIIEICAGTGGLLWVG